MNVAGVELAEPRPVGGGDICRAVRGRTADGREVFAKTLADAPAGFFAAEAHGLELLRTPDGPPLPEVVAVGEDGLVLQWVEPGSPNAAAAERFGRDLARLHRRGGERFGADRPGFVGTLAVDNTPADGWPEFAVRRLRPVLTAARRRDAIGPDDAAAVDAAIRALPDLAGPPEPPARVHGDLWSGNVLWAADGRAWLVDAAAAHDGHREADLAMLALFGAPYLAEILATYTTEHPLAPGWERRVALHQVHPLLVHAVLFGGGYGARAGRAARRASGA